MSEEAGAPIIEFLHMMDRHDLSMALTKERMGFFDITRRYARILEVAIRLVAKYDDTWRKGEMPEPGPWDALMDELAAQIPKEEDDDEPGTGAESVEGV